MAQLEKRKGKKGVGWRLRFKHPGNGELVGIRIAAGTSLADARRWKDAIERALVALASGRGYPDDVLQLFESTDSRTFASLVENGLATAAESLPRLKKYVADFIASRSDWKISTRNKHRQTEAKLAEYFTADPVIDEITLADARAFYRWLQASGLSEATCRGHIRHTRQYFAEAVEAELIGKNPFYSRKLPTGVIAAKDRTSMTLEQTDLVIEKAPDLAWKCYTALMRLAGLRNVSEILRCPATSGHNAYRGLLWGDIDWDQRIMTVHSPKTCRHDGHETRLVPIVPKLYDLLLKAFDAAPEGEDRVVPFGENNLSRDFRLILKAAGIKPWPNLFKAMRVTCATEWSDMLGGDNSHAFLGHSADVGRRHYHSVAPATIAKLTTPVDTPE